MKVINTWICQDHFKIDPAVANAPGPICAACQFGKVHRKAHTMNHDSITSKHLAPGNGKYIYATFHESKDVNGMVKSKKDFQNFAAQYGVCVKTIRADSGAYASTLFKASCEVDQQERTFCAVGGHWQNGVAEWHIGITTQTTQTILLHAMLNWSGIVTDEFWPYAIRHVCTFHNASIWSGLGKSPHHLFTGNKAPWNMSNFWVFVCPVFVLDKRLQDGDSLKKWKAHSWVGVYVGHSLAPSGNVPVIYNPYMTHISHSFMWSLMTIFPPSVA
jgi:hypothetical protein